MKPVKKSSLAGEAERELRTAILSGQFGRQLPGLRVLARVLGVSAPTVAEALKVLAAEGLVRAPGPRRRMEVAKGRAASEPSARPARILWFATSSEFDDAIHGITVIMSFLQQELAGSGWQVRHRVLAYGHSENRSAQWDRMLEAERPDAMVAWSGRPALASWAAERRLRTVFVGGAQSDAGVAMLAVRSTGMVDRALNELMRCGHRRMFLPLCNRPAAMVKAIRGTVAERMRAAGIQGSGRQWVAVSAYQSSAVIEAMVVQALRDQSPTGWVFFDWREYLAATCAFRDLGLSVPRDVSMICLSWDPSMAWYRPAPAHFHQPLAAMAKAAAEWVLDELAAVGTRRFEAEWIPGDSLAEAKV